MLPEEIDQIVAMARSEEYVDLSHRIMAVTACDKDLFQASFSTVYRVLKEQNLMTARGPGGAHNGNSKAPVRKDLTGPNQRWRWDISYLMTLQKGMCLYLYLLLDEYSRKAVQCHLVVALTAGVITVSQLAGRGQGNFLPKSGKGCKILMVANKLDLAKKVELFWR